MLCFSVCNAYISSKRQLVGPMQQRFVEARQAYDDHVSGGRRIPYHLHTDFQSMISIRTPIEQLERYVFEKISLPGRGLAAAVTLIGAVDGLRHAVEYRNGLIEEFRKASPMPNEALIQKYFGLPNSLSAIDDRYRSSVEGIYRQTNDCIFFSKLLADDLLAYGAAFRRRARWRLRIGLPTVAGADWTQAEAAGLIPSEQEYAGWLKGFPKGKSHYEKFVAYASALISEVKRKSSAFPWRRIEKKVHEIFQLLFGISGQIDRSTYWKAFFGGLAMPLVGIGCLILSNGVWAKWTAGALSGLWFISLVAISTQRVSELGWNKLLAPVYALLLLCAVWLFGPLSFLFGIPGILFLGAKGSSRPTRRWRQRK